MDEPTVWQYMIEGPIKIMRLRWQLMDKRKFWIGVLVFCVLALVVYEFIVPGFASAQAWRSVLPILLVAVISILYALRKRTPPA